MPEHTEREPTRPERERPEEAAENAEFIDEGDDAGVGYTSEETERGSSDVERERPAEGDVERERPAKNTWEPRGADRETH